jgi:hypothetical protein
MKPPLLEEVIFKRNQAVVHRRRAKCKKQHKEKEIAKHDRNDKRIKCRKVVETSVSSNEDSSPPPAWRGDEPSAAVDWRDMYGSPLSLLRWAAEVSSMRRSEPAAREKGMGSGSGSLSWARPA